MFKTKNKVVVSLFFIALLLLSTLLPAAAGLQESAASAAENDNGNDNVEEFSDLHAHAAVLMEYSTGKTVYSKNGTEQFYPASLTKIMTILLTFEAVKEGRASWDDTVVVSERAWRQGGSQMFLNLDQEVTLRELVKGVIIVSANDACIAIAEHLSGSKEQFVNEMNAKAGELGLQNTRFQNTSGLHCDDHYTSAEDTAIMARYLVKRHPDALELYSTPAFEFNGIEQYNRNPLLDRVTGADGIKTGFTSKAGYNLVGTAEIDGVRFISVVLKTGSNAERLQDSQVLLSYGFQNYTLHPLYAEEERVNTTAVTGGVEKEMDLLASEKVEVVVPVDRKDDVEVELDVPEKIAAPIEKGQAVGYMDVVLDGEHLLKTELQAAESIERAGFFTLVFRAIIDFFSGLWSGTAEIVSDLLRSLFTSE